ncbi:MAG: GNAT family N-acetyltransferase [Clostridium sp.]|nr:GNAT family N-acetyltransferase [Clostridium sp.]
METPILQTNRLVLRPLKLNDAEHVFKSWTSDPDVVKYMQWDLHENLWDTEEWLASEEDSIDNDENYNWGFVLKETNSLIGSGGFQFDRERNMHEIGYVIMKKYWGQGIASEAVEKIISFAKNTLGIKRMYGKHAKDNPASGRILQKHGFVFKKEKYYPKLSGISGFMCKEWILRL